MTSMIIRIITMPCYESGKLMITTAYYKCETSMMTSLIIITTSFICF